MSDLHFTENGDLALSSEGDLAMVSDPWRDYSQQAYIRLKTAIGDYLMYPGLGADLDRLIGMPQSESTGEIGKYLILKALAREGIFNAMPIDVTAIPISYQSIKFDIYITAGNRNELVLSIIQDLGTEDGALEESNREIEPDLPLVDGDGNLLFTDNLDTYLLGD